MKRIRISHCAAQLLARHAPRRPLCPYAPALQTAAPHNCRIQKRFETTVAIPTDKEIEQELVEEIEEIEDASAPLPGLSRKKTRELKGPQGPYSPPSRASQAATQSIKLAALRSRLCLDKRFPLPTLARTLVHPSARPSGGSNNASLSILGANLLGYYTTEWILCNYPRLPMPVIFAAQHAYIGPKALATIAAEWGIEAAAEPGPEVDPGLLQFKRLKSGAAVPKILRDEAPWKWNNTTTHKILATDALGSNNKPASPHSMRDIAVPLEEAAQSFVRALIGSLHLHLGSPLVKRFFRDHFLSRHLDLSTLFDFRTPTVDLSRLCAREGFEPPVARLISETGRLSRHPVFVVGVYSGKDKLGEGAGSSLEEGRVRAAVAALKAWYLYRPVEVTLPSSTENAIDTSKWKPNMVDCGEVIT